MINKQLNIKNAEGGNNGIPKGYSTLWQGGVRGVTPTTGRGNPRTPYRQRENLSLDSHYAAFGVL